MTDLQTVREALEASLVWRASTLHKFHRPRVEKALEALSRLEAAAEAEYERGRQDGMKQEHALWQMQRIGQELEAAAVPELSREDVVRKAAEAGPFLEQMAKTPWLEELQRFASLVRSVPVGEVKPVAWICVVNTADAGPTKFFTAPSDPRGFPVYTTPPAPIEGWREIMREARDNCEASIAEDGISAMRREYRKELLERMDAVLAAPQPGILRPRSTFKE